MKEFLLDVEPTLEYDVVQINDAYGPTRTEPSFQVRLLRRSVTFRGQTIYFSRGVVDDRS